MIYRIIYSPKARTHLTEIYDYIAAAASTMRAVSYVQELIAACDALCVFPNRGRRRDDLRAGMRTISFRKRITIAYQVINDRVDILEIFYAGRNLQAAFRTEDE